MALKAYRGNIAYTKTKDCFEFLENGYVIVDGAKVVATAGILPDAYRNAEVVDYGDSLIIPGFVDAHVHPCQLPNIGLGYDMELLPWLEAYTYRQEMRFADLSYAHRVYSWYLKELWSNGVTRSIAMATTHKDATVLLMELYAKAGLGAYVGKVNQDCNCGRPEFMEDTDASIRDTEEWLSRTLGISEYVKPILTPTINIICTAKLMKAVGELADRYDLPVQAHLSENRTEVAFCRELYPEEKDFGSVYDKFGLFGTHKTMMAHCIHTTDNEMKLMRERGILAAHCPASNLNLQSGIMQVRRYLDEGIPVGLGSDIAGGDTLSPFANMARAIQSAKMLWLQDADNGRLETTEAFYIATKGGGAFFGKVGSFEPGYDFDALVVDDSRLNSVNGYTMKERIERLIYAGEARDIRERFVAGRNIPEPSLD
jgi:guanine deaminase